VSCCARFFDNGRGKLGDQKRGWNGGSLADRHFSGHHTADAHLTPAAVIGLRRMQSIDLGQYMHAARTPAAAIDTSHIPRDLVA